MHAVRVLECALFDGDRGATHRRGLYGRLGADHANLGVVLGYDGVRELSGLVGECEIEASIVVLCVRDV